MNNLKPVGKWLLLDKYYTAKRAYYEGNPILSDMYFDKLEGSLQAVGGVEFFNLWRTVGYDSDKHKVVRRHLADAETLWRQEHGY